MKGTLAGAGTGRRIVVAILLLISAYAIAQIGVGNGKDADFAGGQFLWGNSLRLAQIIAYLITLTCIVGAIVSFMDKQILGKIVAIIIISLTVFLMIIQPSQQIPFMNFDRKTAVLYFSILPLISGALLFVNGMKLKIYPAPEV